MIKRPCYEDKLWIMPVRGCLKVTMLVYTSVGQAVLCIFVSYYLLCV